MAVARERIQRDEILVGQTGLRHLFGCANCCCCDSGGGPRGAERSGTAGPAAVRLAAAIPVDSPYCSCKLPRTARLSFLREPPSPSLSSRLLEGEGGAAEYDRTLAGGAGLNMFCQCFQLWMHVVPAADVWSAAGTPR